MIAKLVTFIRLPREEKAFFFQALYLLCRCRLKLKTTPLKRLLSMMDEEGRRLRDNRVNFLSVERTGRLIQAAAAVVPFSTCLSTALAGQALFAAGDHSTTLHIGVRNDEKAGFEAHAWLTLGGEVVLGHLPDLASYKPLPPIYA